MNATQSVWPTLAFSAMVTGAAVYHGGADPSWLYFSLTGLLCWAVTLGLARGKAIPANALSAILLAELLWLAILPCFSIIPEISWTCSLSLAALPLAYFAGVVARNNPMQSAMAERVLTLLAAIVFAGAILELLVMRSRSFSLFLDSNLLAAYANIFFFAAAGRVIAVWRVSGMRNALQAKSAVFAALALVAMFATTSLGGFLCFAGGLLLLTLIGGRRIAVFRQAAMLTVVLAVISYSAVYAIQERQSPLSRIALAVDTADTRDVEHAATIWERAVIYNSTIRMIHDQPWYGSGPGTFPTLYPKYRSPDDRSSAGSLVHNDYLQFLLEGGPILLACLLGTLTVIFRSLYRSAKRFWAQPLLVDDSDVGRLGIQVGLLAAFAHAGVNFIFYSLSLSIVLGLFLSRIEPDAEGKKAIDLSRAISPTSSRLITAFAAVLLTFSIGLTGAFARIELGDCSLRSCQELRGNTDRMAKFASMLKALQPSWIGGTNFLVENHLRDASQDPDPIHKWNHVIRATQISSDTLKRYPAIYPQYSVLANIIETYPPASAYVTDGVPSDPAELYRTALQFNPSHALARVRLAAIEANSGDDEAAWNTAFEGMRWWKLNIVTDGDRKLLLDTALPLAVRTRHCVDAREMAEGLKLLDPGSDLAEQVLAALPENIEATNSSANCGLKSRPEVPSWTSHTKTKPSADTPSASQAVRS